MGLKSEVDSLLLQIPNTVLRPAQAYAVGSSPFTLWSVNGGAIEILTLGARVTAAAGGAGTFDLTANGVALDNGAVAVNGAVGTVIYIPLNVGAAILNAAGIPKTVATMTTFIMGTQPAGVAGTIVLTVAVNTITCEFFMVYRKLSAGVTVV